VQLNSVLRVKKCWSRIDRQRPLFDDTGADAIGALVLLAPERAGPQAPRLKGGVVGPRAATIHRHPLAVGQQHAAAGGANRLVEPVHRPLRGGEQRRDTLARLAEFRVGQPLGQAPAGGIEMMQPGRTAPGGHERGASRLA
jgi:hypothetical protein